MSAASEPVIWSPAEQLPRGGAARAAARAAARDLRRRAGRSTARASCRSPASRSSARRTRSGCCASRSHRSSRLHASSGTHGKPTVVGYTAADLEAWTELMARCMTLAGVRPGMLVHNANTYGLFTGGHGFHQGAERIGAPVAAGLRRLHGAAGPAAPRPRRAGARLDALVRARDRAGRARRRHRPGRAEARARPVRRRALDRRPARRDRARAARAPRGQLLRAVGDVRPGRRGRVRRGARRPPRPRGPLPRRGRRSGDRRAGRRGRRGRARLHDAAQGGDAVPALPHRRHRLGHASSRAAAAGRPRGSGACAAGATT